MTVVRTSEVVARHVTGVSHLHHLISDRDVCADDHIDVGTAHDRIIRGLIRTLEPQTNLLSCVRWLVEL